MDFLAPFDRTVLESFFVESRNVVVLVLDASGRILGCNAGFFHLLPFRENPVGQTVQSLLLPESRRVFKSLPEGEAVRTSLSFVANASPPHSLDCRLFFDGERILLTGEGLMLTHDDTLRQIGMLNNELINQARDLARKNRELENARKKIKVLGGMLPICSCCKKIRDDRGYWTQIEGFIREHSEAEFTHGLCPDCLRENYGDMADE
jgi:hypothetical protein